MSETHCPTHDVPWKVVPAGVSRAGKPYDAFRACPVRGCDERPPRPPRRAEAVQTVSATTPIVSTELRLRAAIAACNAAGTRYQGIGFGENDYDGAIDLARKFYVEILLKAMEGKLDPDFDVPDFNR